MATNEITALKVKWTVSRGRDTYGYNICSLWEKTMYKTKYGYTSCNYHKAFSCSGGGYDMLGTVLGEFIEKRYQGELVAMALKAALDKKPPMYTGCVGDLYGCRYLPEKGRVIIDGACGLESVITIAKAIGVDVEVVRDKKGHVVEFYVYKGEAAVNA